jgi:hypothetical protein
MKCEEEKEIFTGYPTEACGLDAIGESREF